MWTIIVHSIPPELKRRSFSQFLHDDSGGLSILDEELYVRYEGAHKGAHCPLYCLP